MKIRVILALGNKILCHSLKESLLRCRLTEIKDCSIDVIEPGSSFPPEGDGHDIIIADHMSLGRIPEKYYDCSKILVMDYGMERESIAALFLTQKIMGVIHSSSEIAMLCKAIRAVSNGEVWIDNHTIKSLITSSLARKVKQSTNLSEREIAIVKLVQEGYRNKELASILSISEQTVKSHLNRIFRKVNVTSRAELIKKLNGTLKA